MPIIQMTGEMRTRAPDKMGNDLNRKTEKVEGGVCPKLNDLDHWTRNKHNFSDGMWSSIVLYIV